MRERVVSALRGAFFEALPAARRRAVDGGAADDRDDVPFAPEATRAQRRVADRRAPEFEESDEDSDELVEYVAGAARAAAHPAADRRVAFARTLLYCFVLSADAND